MQQSLDTVHLAMTKQNKTSDKTVEKKNKKKLPIGQCWQLY